MRMSCLITTLNPMTEITNPARLIQSPTLIFIGSSALIIEKGRATFTLFLGDTTLGAERDLRASAVPLSSAISQPPIGQTDGAARCQGHRPSATTADSSISGVVPNGISDGNRDGNDGGMFRETVAMSKAYAEARAQHGDSELLDEIVTAKPQVDQTPTTPRGCRLPRR